MWYEFLNEFTDKLMNGHIEVVREPGHAEIVFCTSNKGEVTNIVEYSECYGTSSTMERSVGLNTGR